MPCACVLPRTVPGVTAWPQRPAQDSERGCFHKLSHSGATDLCVCTRKEGGRKEGGQAEGKLLEG